MRPHHRDTHLGKLLHSRRSARSCCLSMSLNVSVSDDWPRGVSPPSSLESKSANDVLRNVREPLVCVCSLHTPPPRHIIPQPHGFISLAWCCSHDRHPVRNGHIARPRLNSITTYLPAHRQHQLRPHARGDLVRRHLGSMHADDVAVLEPRQALDGGAEAHDVGGVRLLRAVAARARVRDLELDVPVCVPQAQRPMSRAHHVTPLPRGGWRQKRWYTALLREAVKRMIRGHRGGSSQVRVSNLFSSFVLAILRMRSHSRRLSTSIAPDRYRGGEMWRGVHLPRTHKLTTAAAFRVFIVELGEGQPGAL